MGAHESGGCLLSVPFQRGDANADGRRTVNDAVVVLVLLFRGGTEPPCLNAADSDDSGHVDVADAIHLLNFLFRGGLPPPAPYPGCGVDRKRLSCESYEHCP